MFREIPSKFSNQIVQTYGKMVPVPMMNCFQPPYSIVSRCYESFLQIKLQILCAEQVHVQIANEVIVRLHDVKFIRKNSQCKLHKMR